MGIFFSPGCVIDGIGFELDEVSACWGRAASKDGGGGKSVACSMMEGSSGAGTSEPDDTSDIAWDPQQNEQTVQGLVLES